VARPLSAQSLIAIFLREKKISDGFTAYKMNLHAWLRHDSLKNLEVVLCPALPEIFRDIPKEDFALQKYTCRGNDEPIS
jgi:hypothetical protein